MKKYWILILIVFCSLIGQSQNVSKLRPAMVVWQMNNEKIPLLEAKKGIAVKDSIEIEIFFNKVVYDNTVTSKEVTFEFRWYYYLSTRRELMKIEKISSDKLDNSIKNAYILKSKMPTQTPGWWEVQIICSVDNGLLEWANNNKFQILINK